MNFLRYSKNVSVLFCILVIAFLITDNLKGQSHNQKGTLPGEISFDFTQLQLPGSKEAGESFPYPPNWARPESSRVEPHFLIVTLQANPRIGNIPIQQGDYVGAFFVGDNGELVCGGAGYWKADSTIIFAITGDDPQTTHKEGFSYGAVINYRLFSFTTMKDYTVTTISFDTSPGSGFISGVKWYPLALSSATNVKANVTFDAYAKADQNPICTGESSQLNAVVFIGPGEPYTYNWTSNPSGFTSSLKNPVVSPGITTQYLLTTHSGTLTSEHSVTVLVNVNPTVNAGIDGTLCANGTWQLSGQASNYDSVLWSTDGDGTFNDPTILNPVYVFGLNDKQGTSVTLSVSALPLEGCITSASDEIVLTILPLPDVDLGPDALICVSSAIPLNPIAHNYSTVTWVTSGDGTFSNVNIINPLYTPGSGDNNSATVNLTCSISAASPCIATVMDEIKYDFVQAPTANGPGSRTICETSNTAVINGSATNYGSILWTTAGDGTFLNPAVLAVTYCPGPNDKQNGLAVVSLNAFPNTPCTLPATKQINVIIKKLPVVTINSTNKVCQGFPLQLNASGSNYFGIAWSTLGNGFFNSTTILNPVYTPGTIDIAAGNFKVVLKGIASMPCSLPDYDTLQVTIVNNPSVQINTTSNQLLCTTEPLSLSATANDYNNLLWTTSGDGSFAYVDSLNPVYWPGLDTDILGNPVTLTLTAYAVQNCGPNVTDQILVSFLEGPSSNAGQDATICSSSTYQLSGAATYTGSILWTSSGDGSFDDPAILNPVYSTGTADDSSDSVVLTLTAANVTPCTISKSDMMVLTISGHPIANAGIDDTVAMGSGYHLVNASAQNATSFLWSTLGDGTFNNPNICNPIYTPGVNDTTNALVSLIFTADNEYCDFSSDTIILTVEDQSAFPTSYAGADTTICFGNTYLLFDALATQFSSLIWSTAGDGTFSNPNLLHPIYAPGANDLLNGVVNLCLKAFPNTGITSVAKDSVELVIQKTPTANAGNDATTCQGSPHTLAGTAANHASVSWTTSGNGTFSSTTALNPVYTPGTADITSVTLTLTASAISPCTVSTSDSKILTIQKTPTANAGNDATTCQGSPHTITGATAANQISVLWTTSGNGTFSSISSLNPVYTPGTTDFTAGTVTLTLTALATSPCTVSVTDPKILSIQKTPTANAGTDATVCQGGTHTLAGTATNQASVLWTTSGNGTFSSTSSLNPVYTPGTSDFTAGSVTLTLAALATSPCTVSATDAKILTIQKTPTANAGTDNTTCQGIPQTLNGATATNYSSVLWTSSGNGTFSSTSSLTPVYTPGAADITFVTLTLTASAISPCTVSATDTKILTIQKTPTPNAGNDATVCQGSAHTLAGTATNQTSVLWTTSGNGTFSSTSSLTPVYTPGTNDITAGTVTLTLTATAILPCTASVADSKILTIQKTATANAGTDATVCQGSTHTLAGTATNHLSVLWTTSGNGTFSPTNSLTPVYTPGTNDVTAGTVTLTLTALATSPCTVSATDTKILTIQKSPTANAGNDATICQGSTHTLAGAATNHASVLWTKSGTGTFSNAAILNPVYTPGAADITNGTVTLTLTALATSPCTVSATDTKILTIQKTPTANAGNDATVCQGSTHTLSGAATNQASVSWTTSGNGTFSSTTALNPTYTPGTNDVTAGTVTLTLTALATSPCTVSATDAKILTIQKTPTANAGVDATVCQGSTHTLSGEATNQASVSWTTSGNGTFSSTTALNPTYTPGTNDVTAGTVTLTLTALATSPCTVSATDAKILTIQKTPTANAGTDATVCQGSTHILSGAATNQASVSWTTSGNGTFSSTTALNPIYTPGTSDISIGTVTLTLTALATSPCTVSATDTKILTIQKTPTANAGADATVCQGSTHTLSGAATNQVSVSWTTSENGTFSSTTALNPTYTPGTSDISIGTVTLTLTALATSPCTVSATDAKILTIQKTPTANAGLDATVCQGSTHTLSGEATNQASVSWTTSGNGTFSSTTALNPTYTPGTNDVTAGTVTLTLTALATSPCTVSATDTKILTIQKTPTANAGTDATVCQGSTHTLAGTAANQTSVLWTTSGNGTFSSTSSLTAVYTPGTNDISNGTVTLTLTALATSPCTVTETDAKILTIQNTPTANAGSDATVCQGSTHTLSGAATNQASVSWTTSGNGTFSSTTALNPTYTPGTNDVTAGTVTLTLTALATSPCTVSATDTKILTIQKTPTANAGADATVCQGSTHALAGTATNQTSVLWTTSGNGTFSSTTALNPTYTPGTNDNTAGTVTLTLTSTAISPCTAQVSDDMSLIIQKAPIAFAGTDATIPADVPYPTTNASAANWSSVQWTTSGDGEFFDPTQLYTEYNPGPEDYFNQSVILTLTADNNFCEPVSHSMNLFFFMNQPDPIVFPGNDFTLCNEPNYHISDAWAQNYSTLLWSTSGDGTFDNVTLQNPVYTPGILDKSTGSAELCIEAQPNSRSTRAASGCMILTIQKSPVADAGDDATLCEQETHLLDGTAENFASVLWSTSGNGTFGSTGSPTTVYTPGVADITSGSVTLTLTALAISPCTVSANDSKILIIQKTPTANAGIDGSVCQGGTHTLTDATATYQASVLWSTSGNGTFSSTSTLNPVYTPGVTDVTSGTVTLTLTASAISPCTVSATVNKILIIQKTPTANAGSDATVCQESIHALAGTATNQASVLWTTSGNGTFSSTSSLTPVYTPGTTDVTNGTATLTLTASAISPCTVSSTDSKILFIQKTPTANAGTNATICQTETYQLSGTATNQSSVLWSTTENGTFSNPNILNPVYTPCVAEIANGLAVLTLTANPFSPCSVAADDVLNLTIQKLPTVNVGADATICQGSSLQLNGIAQFNQSVLWMTTGNGTFSSTSSLNPVYTPGTTDVTNGMVTLSMMALASSPCTSSASDQMVLTLQTPPTANAGADATICQTETYQLSGTATNQSSVLWSTTENGTFSNPNILNPVYTPCVAEIANGLVVLTLTANPFSPCSVAFDDVINVTIRKTPTANAGNDATICEGNTHVLDGSATNQESVLWMTTGNGTFSSTSSLNPVYTPGTTDVTNGAVTLTLTASAISPCTVSATDTKILIIQKTPTANAGNDASICDGNTHVLDGSATNQASVLWTTSGNGTFSSTSALTPVYTPGTTDVSIGTVTLTLTGSAISPCTVSAIDAIILTIQKTPIANAGNDASICEENTHVLEGSATNQESVLWTTSGNGTFSSTSSLTPVYTPGTSDISAGSVNLVMMALASSPCTVSSSDLMVLTIQSQPTANAGVDATICQAENYQLSGDAENDANIIWSTSGDGTFSSTSSLNPVYSPGPLDIETGNVILTLDVTPVSPCLTIASDLMNLFIQKNSLVFAGNDATFCTNQTCEISGSSIFVESVMWLSTGDGYFEDASSTSTIYYPGSEDLIKKTIELCLVGVGINGCSGNEDCLIVTFVEPPSVSAGSDLNICEDNNALLQASASNYNSLLWSTSGDGTFNDMFSLSAIYIPGNLDKISGSVELCIEANPQSGCEAINDCINLILSPVPVVYAGADVSIQQGLNFVANEATASDYSSVLWTTSGTGSFNDATVLFAEYLPSESDYLNENVTLKIVGSAVSPCEIDASDELILSFTVTSAFAGDDAIVCTDTSFYTAGSATNYASVKWTTSGDGTFDDDTILSARYFAGADDISAGFTELCITVHAPVNNDEKSDCMILSFQKPPTFFAGNDATILFGEPFPLKEALAVNTTQIQWFTVNGSGYFSDETVMNPEYFPGGFDNLQEYIVLGASVSAIQPCEVSREDFMHLTLISECQDAIAEAGDDISICNNQGSIQLSGSGSNYGELKWTSGGSGYFENQNSPNATYYLSETDKLEAEITLYLHATAVDTCADASDSLKIFIQQAGAVSAGNDITICDDENALLEGNSSITTNLYWSTDGDGIFSDLNILNPVYSPGSQDLADGNVTLCIHLTEGSCEDNSDCMVLTFQKSPVVLAGDDASICEGNTHTLAGTATNQASVLWTTSGNGTFGSASSLTTVYTPGTNDFTAGTVTLTLMASATSPCNISATDAIILTIQKTPTASAGNDASICEGSTHTLTDATATNQASVLWSTSGNGTFGSAGSLTSIYTPGTNDFTAGTVTLTLTASATSPCTISATDAKILSIQKTPTANAGSNASICEGSTHTLAGTATNQSSVLWTTSGNGTFGSAGSPTTVYTPGTNDFTVGVVTLTLTASAISPCTISATDAIILTIQKIPTATAGNDASICEGSTHILDGSTTNQASILWTTSGNGTFSSTSTLTPVYTPGIEDITAGTVTLTLTASATSPCTISATDAKILTIQKTPTASAGNEASICEGSTHFLAGTATNQASVLWSTSGNGTFGSAGSPTTVYTPGTTDISFGTVTLTLSASATSPCTISATDAIILSIQKTPTANAGSDASICEGSTHFLAGTATNQASVLWTTSGNGTFGSTGSPTTVYTPGTNDFTAGTVTLTLTASAISPCAVSATDAKILTIQKTPTANAGNDASICEGSIHTLAGTATNQASVLWTTSGNGTFGSAGSPTTVYSPGTIDIIAGSVTLTLTASATSPCTVSATDAIILNIQKAPTASAGNDASICEGSTHTLAGIATNQASVLWTTSGNGTFGSAGSPTTVYTPGTTDISFGTVTLTLTASAISPCTVSATDAIILSIQKTPTANAGNDASICEGSTHTLAGTATNQANVLWTTSANGTFGSAGSPTTVYTPGVADITSGSVTLTLTASATSPCTVSATDAIILTIQKAPTASAGNDASICEGSTHTLAGAASNHTNVLWTTSGNGTFSSTSVLNPVYMPGTTDVSNGTVTLTLTASAISPCTISATDTKILAIQKTPTANAGADATICYTETYHFSGTAQHYASVLWMTSGNGTFSNPNMLNPVYTPCVGEIANGLAILTLTAIPVSPCSVATDDVFNLTIQKQATATVGSDATICSGGSHQLTGAAQFNQGVLWTTSGNGTFSSTSSLNPLYTPGTTDISSGSATLMMMALAVSPCTYSASDFMILTIQSPPTANAGNNATVRMQEPYTLVNASAGDYSDVVWATIIGSGDFDFPEVLNPTFYPSVEDYEFGYVELELTALPINPCIISVSDVMTLTFEDVCHDAVADAGTDLQVCVPGVVQLNGVTSYSNLVLWATDGDGTFTNQNSLVTDYIPGIGDINQGNVGLCLTAFANEPCLNNTDCITVTLPKSPSANAGSDLTICENTTFILLQGAATNYTSVQWSTSGTGTLLNPVSLNAKYIISHDDKSEGQIEFFLKAFNNNCDPYTDSFILVINLTPIILPFDDATICSNKSFNNTGSFVLNADSILWSTSGDGTFSDPTLQENEYFPGTNDINNGFADLCLTGFAADQCADLTECFRLTILPSPVIVPGNDLTVCENASIQMNVIASLYDEIEWTTAGDGTFSDPNILNPVYTPGLADVANESVILTINANTQNNCDDASDEIILSIERSPEVLAGSDFTVCQNTPVQLNGQAQNYSTVYWSTMGDGTFDNNGKLDAVYFTGSSDVEQGFAELCLYANPVDVCTVSSDCLIVTMTPAPSAIAGEDLTICETSAVVLNGQASYYSEILWSTTGDGTFGNSASLGTTYFPGAGDRAIGNTSLCLIAIGTYDCENDEDCLQVSYLQTAQVEAGINFTICQGENAYLNGETEYVESTTWSTSGDGTFSDITILNPVYSPGVQDLLAGNFTLFLTGTTQLTCGELFDSLVVSIQKPPTFFAGNDETILFGEPFQLSGAIAENHNKIQWFTTNGTGIFSDETVMNPVYYPSPIDAGQDYIVLGAGVSAIQPCVVSTTDEMHLKILFACQDAVADAGDDVTICNNESSIQLSAVADYYDQIDWTSGGSGYFENQNNLDATYFLSGADMLETEITLYVYATAIDTCSNATDSIKIFIQPAPVVVAGNDLTICQNQVAELNDASAAGYSSLNWSTGGDGTFADENQETTSYTPGELDILNRQVILTLTAAPNAPCSVMISSELLLNIQGDIVIYQQITDAEVKVGENVDFTIGADFAAQYAWYGPQGLIPEATGPVLSITNAVLDDAGTYYCEISNSCGSINSNNALLTVNQEHLIMMPAGWSGISSWITPNELDLELLFAQMGSNLILLKNFEGVCYPGLKINTLVMWDTQIGYEIKTLAAGSISFEGYENINKTISINQGWNYLPVISTCLVDVQSAFGGNMCIDIIKEVACSGIYWPAMGINSIGNLKPGKAYLLRANQACTYTFPSCTSKSGFIPDNSKPANNTTWNDPVNTPSTHLVAFDDQLLETFRFGDVIGAFTLDGRCTGLMEIENSKNALTIYADDVYTTEHDGFAENEIMTFRLYRQATGEEFELSLSFDMSFPNNNGVFAANGVSRVYKAVLNSVYEPGQSSINVFPNPTKGKVNILGLTGSAKVEIYNTEGQLLRTESCFDTNDNQPFAVDLSGYNSGIIYLRIIVKQNVVITKVILQ